MRNLISCMTHNIIYRIVLFIWNVIGRFHGCLTCAFRWGVSFVGEFFYWALLILLWDHLSGVGDVQGDDAPTRL